MVLRIDILEQMCGEGAAEGVTRDPLRDARGARRIADAPLRHGFVREYITTSLTR